ncbi:MAG TPA: glycosyltransferase family 2 protein, partial [Cyclobacteriaceae bacterium]|nr:glycosyltransferase family 2 protein [Cyclobacteriaceae bacterium]
STYNNPAWLEKVIWGYELQTHTDFEFIVADDGSGEETRSLIEQYQKASRMKIVHVWHPDKGFQKSAILNKAVAASTTSYLIFSDGDCIPRKDFVETHVRNAKQGYFLSGGYFKLPMETSKAVSREDVENQNAFNVNWLHAHGLKKTYKELKLVSRGLQQYLLNWLTPTKPTWNGHGSSGWKKDILAVNGYNEEMQYGGQDRELGERLVNLGIKGKQIRYSAVCVHLDHKRGYNTPESIHKNRKIRQQTRFQRKVWTRNGIINSNLQAA